MLGQTSLSYDGSLRDIEDSTFRRLIETETHFSLGWPGTGCVVQEGLEYLSTDFVTVVLMQNYQREA